MLNLKSEVEYMMLAYKHLYEIETTLRKIIHDRLSSDYGENWIYIAPKKQLKRFAKPLENAHLHEVLDYFNVYSQLRTIFSQQEKVSLNSLLYIRNKIAHCRKIDPEEFRKLKNLNKLVKSKYQINL